jgi:hypothetical protein
MIPGVMLFLLERLPQLRQIGPQHGLLSAHRKQLEQSKLHPIHEALTCDSQCQACHED